VTAGAAGTVSAVAAVSAVTARPAGTVSAVTAVTAVAAGTVSAVTARRCHRGVDDHGDLRVLVVFEKPKSARRGHRQQKNRSGGGPSDRTSHSTPAFL